MHFRHCNSILVSLCWRSSFISNNMKIIMLPSFFSFLLVNTCLGRLESLQNFVVFLCCAGWITICVHGSTRRPSKALHGMYVHSCCPAERLLPCRCGQHRKRRLNWYTDTSSTPHHHRNLFYGMSFFTFLRSFQNFYDINFNLTFTRLVLSTFVFWPPLVL